MRSSLFLALVLLVGSVAASASGLISKQKAEQDALAAVGGGTVIQAVLDTNLGKRTWSVDIVGSTHEYEVWVGAYTGAILKIIVQPLASPNLGFISKSQAEQEALNAVGGGAIVQTVLKTENGNKIYSVDITGNEAEHEVSVDANSGAILKIVTQPSTAASCKFISESVAQKNALAAVGGGTVIQAVLEKSDVPPDWSFDILLNNGGEDEVKVNACNGKIVAIIVGG